MLPPDLSRCSSPEISHLRNGLKLFSQPCGSHGPGSNLRWVLLGPVPSSFHQGDELCESPRSLDGP